jgi:hypothetical protein
MRPLVPNMTERRLAVGQFLVDLSTIDGADIVIKRDHRLRNLAQVFKTQAEPGSRRFPVRFHIYGRGMKGVRHLQPSQAYVDVGSAVKRARVWSVAGDQWFHRLQSSEEV